MSVCSADRAVSTRRRRHSFSSAVGLLGSPNGCLMLSVGMILFAPTLSAREESVVSSTAGIPARSNSLTIVAPQRVPVPQVAGKTTPFTPAANNSFAISLPYFWALAMVLEYHRQRPKIWQRDREGIISGRSEGRGFSCHLRHRHSLRRNDGQRVGASRNTGSAADH